MCLRVNAVMRRTAQTSPASEASPETIEYKTLTLNSKKKTLHLDNEMVQLTKKEFEIIELFLNNRGHLVSRTEILDRVWRNESIVTDRTVDVNITRLRKKIGQYGANITTRQGFGYCFEEL